MGLVTVGGYNGSSLDSVLATRDGLRFEALAPLPLGADSGCLTAIDGQSLLHSGGVTSGGNNAAFLYDIPGNAWTRWARKIDIRTVECQSREILGT